MYKVSLKICEVIKIKDLETNRYILNGIIDEDSIKENNKKMYKMLKRERLLFQIKPENTQTKINLTDLEKKFISNFITYGNASIPHVRKPDESFYNELVTFLSYM